MLAQPDDAVAVGAVEQLRQRSLALDLRPVGQVCAVELQEVEDVVDEVLLAGA